MVSNFEKEIRDYLKGGGYVTDDYIQDRLKVRQHWLNNQAYQASLTEDDADDKKVAGYKSNDEFMSGIHSSLGTDTTKVDQATAARVEQEKKEESEAQPESSDTQETPVADGTWVHPLNGDGTWKQGVSGSHNGVDLAAPEGTSVHSVADGKVIAINWDDPNKALNGICIKIDHGNGIISKYLHLSKLHVASGDTVTKGELIGEVGNTGHVISGGKHYYNKRTQNPNGKGNHLHLEFAKSSKHDSIINPTDYIKFDTGGYTGDWGPEGRLAVLHQKEIILNAKDTENFLTATHMLREISDMLDNNALVASLGAFNLQALTLNTPADQILQQEVTIHADFPNVTDHNEIELAIDNLINAASQHAYK